jgi:hypothetical protein
VPSKAAVNVVTVQYAKAFPGIRINAVEDWASPSKGLAIEPQGNWLVAALVAEFALMIPRRFLGGSGKLP